MRARPGDALATLPSGNRRLILGVVLTVGSLGSGLAQPTSGARSLFDEPALAKAASFDLMFETVGGLVARARSASGADLRVAPLVSERTAHVFVADRPLAWTLEKVAATLDLEWVRRGDHWFLQQPTAAGAALRSYQDNLRRTGVDGVVARLAEIGQLSPSQIQLRIQALDAERTALEQDLANADLQAHVRILEQIADLRQALSSTYPIALLARDPSVRARLARGEAVAAAFPPRPGTVPLPRDALQWVSETQRAEGADSIAVLAIPGSRSLRFVTAAWSSQTPGRRISHAGEIELPDPPEPPPAWTRRQETWATPEGELETHPLLSRPVESRRPDEPFRTSWFGRVVADGDLLRDLHRRSGIDVVAEAYRSVVVSPLSTSGAKTVADWLGAARQRLFGMFRLEDGALLYRAHAAPQHLATAIRESDLRRVEAAAPSPGADPPIDAYASVAADIRGDQAEALRVLTVSPEPLNRARPQLALFWSLNADQRRRLVERVPVRFNELNAVQRAHFVDAMLHAALISGRADLVVDVLTSPDLSELAVLLEQELFEVRIVDGADEPIRVSATAGAAPPTAGTIRTRLYRFFFGFDAERAGTVEFQIRERTPDPPPSDSGPG